METFADIVNSLIPPKVSLAKLSREADIEYSYFHGLMQGHRRIPGAPEGGPGRVLRASSDKGMAVLDALERIGVTVTQDHRERMLTACLKVPEGYRLVSDGKTGNSSPEDLNLLYASGWSMMSGEDKQMFGELIGAWTARKSRQPVEQRNAEESGQQQ